MKNQTKIDKILVLVKDKIEDEVGALMGVDFTLSDPFNQLVSKEDYFGELTGKKIVAKLDVTGEIEGQGGLVVDVKDAIRLGGTLIMLPPAELDEVVRSEDYTDETEDSYGEIANIIAGSYTKVFEDMYPKNCRFVRKEQELISPLKIDIESDQPFPEQWYYLSRMSMAIDGLQMGEVDMLIPAEPFGIEIPEQQDSGKDNIQQETTKDAGEEVSPKKTSESDATSDSVISTAEEQTKSEDVEKITPSNSIKQQKKIDKILVSVKEKIEVEVGALMGVDFTLSDPFKQLISKEDYFGELTGKKIVAKLDVTGEIEGRGGLIVDVKDAIRLGGTLIMLPPAELDEVVRNEEYTDETEDSYGEIANIIAGSYTKVFEDMYPQNCRFVRKEQELISPLKIDIESDQPFPEQLYYLSRMSMAIDGLQMGEVDMLIPAEPFGIEILEQQGSIKENVQQDTTKDAVEEISPKQPQENDSISGSVITTAEEQAKTESLETKTPSIDIKKQQKLVDKLLDTCQKKIAEEVGALLGVDIKLNDLGNRAVTKEEYFLEEAVGKQVLAHMDVIEEKEDKSFLFVSVKDAIRIGSILIMLPPSELEESVNEEDFSADAEDAYGEIANIISGVYTSVFQDQYPQSFRFIRKDLEIVAPMKVDTDSNDIIENQSYYMSNSNLEIDGKKFGKIAMLFPLALLKLDLLGSSDTILEEDAATTAHDLGAVQQVQSSADTTGVSMEPTGKIVAQDGVADDIDILLIEDDREEAEKIQKELTSSGIGSKTITFSDSINYHISPSLKLIIIVMKEVNEQAYGITIKVNSLSNVPIVAAGPEWTRTKVIKAVKYGVNDILLTPAMESDIREKIEDNFIKLAA